MRSVWFYLLVGALLCVYTNAQGLSTSPTPEPFLSTTLMTTTNEPGCYNTGSECGSFGLSGHCRQKICRTGEDRIYDFEGPCNGSSCVCCTDLSTSPTPEPFLSTSLMTTTNAPVNSRPGCEGVKCTWNLWAHYHAKGCIPEYTNGSCCPTHFTCPQRDHLNPEKCYLFGKEYNLGDDVRMNGADDPCDSGCHCNPGFPGARAHISCAEDFGVCWDPIPPSPGCWNRRKLCGGCAEEVCDGSMPIPHLCRWNNKTYKEGAYMDFDGEYACYWCICQKNFTGPTGEGCQKLRCGSRGIGGNSRRCVDVYHKGDCCPRELVCDFDREIQSIPTTPRESSGLTCTLGKFTRSVGEHLEYGDCRTNCTCITPPEFTCIKTRNCLPEVPEAEQCPFNSDCTNGECRQDCGDLVEVANVCSGNGCKCCKHELCAEETGMCRMRCLDDEYEDTWTGFGCAYANGFVEPKPKCCVKI